MIENAKRKFLLKKYVETFSVAEDKILIDIAGSQYSVAGDVVRLILKDLIEFLRTERTREEIVGRYASVATEIELDEIVQDLAKIGLLVDYSIEQCSEFADASDPVKTKYLKFFEYCAAFTRKEPMVSYQSLRNGTVLFVIGAEVAATLEDRFFPTLPYKASLIVADDKLRERLENVFAEKKPDLVVCVSGPFLLALNKEVNALCISHSVKALFSEMNWYGGTIGPAVIPGETACYECGNLRKGSNMQDLQIFNLMNSESAHDLDVRQVNVTDVYQSAFLSLLLIEIEKILTSCAYSGTYKGIYHVNLGGFTQSFHPLLKSPFCPRCGYIAKTPKKMTIDKDGIRC